MRDYKAEITDACKDAGTYQPYFDAVIDTLADILIMRADAREKFIASGADTVVYHTNKNGSTNIVKNPALVVIMDLNMQAITYWRELGLTAKSYKQMFGDIKQDTGASLESILASLEED